jgi:hypothetical protein
MVQRFSDKGEGGGAIDQGRRPAPLFVGLPPRPRPLIGRDEELAALRSKVCAGGASALTALNGLPGVGKTALATALVHDPEVRAHFCGGVFWVGHLGPRTGPSPRLESG